MYRLLDYDKKRSAVTERSEEVIKHIGKSSKLLTEHFNFKSKI